MEKVENILTRGKIPFPIYRRFLTHLQQSRLLKTLWQKEKLLMMSNFSICPNILNFLYWLYFHWPSISIFLSRCVQRRLLQTCCMWERTTIIVFLFSQINMISKYIQGTWNMNKWNNYMKVFFCFQKGKMIAHTMIKWR